MVVVVAVVARKEAEVEERVGDVHVPTLTRLPGASCCCGGSGVSALFLGRRASISSDVEACASARSNACTCTTGERRAVCVREGMRATEG